MSAKASHEGYYLIVGVALAFAVQVLYDIFGEVAATWPNPRLSSKSWFGLLIDAALYFYILRYRASLKPHKD